MKPWGRAVWPAPQSKGTGMLNLPRRSILLGLSALPFAGGTARAADTPILLRDLYNKDLSFSPLAEEKQG